MANDNPWSAEGWNITEQAVYVRQYGDVRAAARARDAGTWIGGPRPGSIEQSKDVNPWSVLGWNLSAQSMYIRSYGQARAEARARDAGTYLGGPPPVPTMEELADPLLIRPGQQAIYKVPKGAFVPARRPHVIPIPASRPNLGFVQAVVLQLERDLAASALLGIEQAVMLTLSSPESDISAMVEIGILQAVVIQLERDLSATAELGISVAAAIDTTGNNRIATDGTTRITTDGTIRVIAL